MDLVPGRRRSGSWCGMVEGYGTDAYHGLLSAATTRSLHWRVGSWEWLGKCERDWEKQWRHRPGLLRSGIFQPRMIRCWFQHAQGAAMKEPQHGTTLVLVPSGPTVPGIANIRR